MQLRCFRCFIEGFYNYESYGTEDEACDTEDADTKVHGNQGVQWADTDAFAEEFGFEEFAQDDAEDKYGQENGAGYIVSLKEEYDTPGKQYHAASKDRKCIQQGDGESQKQGIRIFD